MPVYTIPQLQSAKPRESAKPSARVSSVLKLLLGCTVQPQESWIVKLSIAFEKASSETPD